MARMAPSRQGDMDGPQDKLGVSRKISNTKKKSKKPRKSSLGAGQPLRADYSCQLPACLLAGLLASRNNSGIFKIHRAQHLLIGVRGQPQGNGTMFDTIFPAIGR